MRNFMAFLMLMIIAPIWMIVPVLAYDSGSLGPCDTGNQADLYCLYKGGCAHHGYCYFPDGSYYLTWSLYDRVYNGCGGFGFGASSQRAWEADVYNFLNGINCYSANPFGLRLGNSTAAVRSY
jgi:hypothetical protein